MCAGRQDRRPDVSPEDYPRAEELPGPPSQMSLQDRSVDVMRAVDLVQLGDRVGNPRQNRSATSKMYVPKREKVKKEDEQR